MKNTLIWLILSWVSLTACRPSSSALPASHLSKTFHTDGVDLSYSVTGRGAPIYLLHGGMESRDVFTDQISALSQSYTVVALDSREQGRSSRSDAQISYTLMSQDVLALADHLGHDRLTLMGSSDGGVTALTTAIARPERVDTLILLGTNYHFEAYPKATRDFIANYEWDGQAVDPDSYPGIFIKHYKTGHDTLDGFGDLLEEMSVIWTTSPTFTPSDLAAVQARTLIINGDREDIALPHVLSLYGAIPDARLFVVPGATHYVAQEKSALINSVVLEFMRDNAPPP